MNKEWVVAQIHEIEKMIENASAILSHYSPDSADFERNFNRRADLFRSLRILNGML